MKIIDAIQKVIKTEENSSHADIDTFSQAVDLDIYIGWNEEWDKRVKGYWLIRWLCTDTFVGRRVYFFDEKPFAVSNQSARKNPEVIQFLDNDSANAIREFILNLDGKDKPEFDIIDGQEDLEDFYNFDLTDYFIERNAFVDGLPVEIIKNRYFKDNDEKRWTCRNCVVKFETGEERVVRAGDVQFPLRVQI